MSLPEAVSRWLSQRRPWSVGAIAMAGGGALAWLAGRPQWQVLAMGLAALLAGVVLTSMVARGLRDATPAPAAGRVRSSEGDFDPDEVLTQDVNSGRIWRLGEVHFLGAAEKRRLAAERPHVWRAYRARLFPLPQVPLQRVNDDSAPRTAAPPAASE